jgi:hypothetical protein
VRSMQQQKRDIRALLRAEAEITDPEERAEITEQTERS